MNQLHYYRLMAEANRRQSLPPPREENADGSASATGTTTNPPPRPPTPFPSPALVRFVNLSPNFLWNRNFLTIRQPTAPNILGVDGCHLAMPWFPWCSPYQALQSQQVDYAARAQLLVEQEREMRKYQCEECQRSFKSTTTLAAHHNRRLGRKFHCSEPFCNFSSYHTKYLKKHIVRCKVKTVNEGQANYQRNHLASTTSLASSSAQNGFPSAAPSLGVESMAEIDQLVNYVLQNDEEKFRPEQNVEEK